MNLPNMISLFRIIFVPIILILMLINWDQAIIINNFHLTIAWLIAGVLFIIAALSDLLDGYLARKQNKVTTFGKFFDSIADKLLTNGVLIAMSYVGVMPIWITLILVLRDFLIDALRQILATKNVVMDANWYGKWKAGIQMLGLTILFFVNYQSFNGSSTGSGCYDQYGLINQLILIPTYLATILSIYSAGVYFSLNYKYLIEKTPKPKTK
ncbi:MAG: CDP-diacylglycerol--glycerol-3-phosphate 3-phosphatidyltransferase [Spiroplasma sp.]|nr:CDP-diacylglycerol--glycerol-3-phosphate 3-phosphatidyltransferase [Spiroplasma sp.]